MPVVVAFLFFAALAGMLTSSWNRSSYLTMALAATLLCGLYLFAEGLW